MELAEEFGVSRARVRQIEVSAFEKVQNAVKHCVAAMGRWRLCRCVSFQSSPVVGETDVGRVAMVRFTATERRERGAAHRVLIEPSLDDPCTALCVIDRAPKPRAANGKLSDIS